MESLDRLRVFKAVASERSFSRAARRVHRTQPAVSQSIKALEEELGERLFVRRGRNIDLTQAGQVLLDEVGAAFACLSRAEARVAALQELREGELSLATSDTTACYVLPPLLAQFRQRYPGVTLKILNRPSPRAAELVREMSADLAVVTLPVEGRGLTVEDLGPREDLAVFAPSHPLATRKRVRFADLLDYPLLALDRGSNSRAFLDREIARSGLSAELTMELGSIEVIKRLVALNFGVALVPADAVVEELRRGELASARVLARKQLRHLGVVAPTCGPSSLAAGVFAEMLRQACAAPEFILRRQALRAAEPSLRRAAARASEV